VLSHISQGTSQLFLEKTHRQCRFPAQERATAEAVLASYKPSLASLKLILQPATPPMAPPSSGGGVGGGMSPGEYGERKADETANCMDEGVIREEPESRLPSYCR